MKSLSRLKLSGTERVSAVLIFTVHQYPGKRGYLNDLAASGMLSECFLFLKKTKQYPAVPLGKIQFIEVHTEQYLYCAV